MEFKNVFFPGKGHQKVPYRGAKNLGITITGRRSREAMKRVGPRVCLKPRGQRGLDESNGALNEGVMKGPKFPAKPMKGERTFSLLGRSFNETSTGLGKEGENIGLHPKSYMKSCAKGKSKGLPNRRAEGVQRGKACLSRR